MGENINGTNGKADNSVDKSTGKTATAGTTVSGSGSSTNTGTTAGTGTGTGTGTTTGARATTKGKQTEKSSELPPIVVPQPEEKKKRGRPPKTTTSVKTKKNETSLNVSQITALIVATSSMMASREGFEHWMITEKEAQQIAQPLSNIIENNESFKKIAEHSDSIALVTACIMIFAPRIVITIQKGKKKKSVKKELKKIDNSGTSKTDNRRNDGQNSDSGNDVGSSIYGSIPSII